MWHVLSGVQTGDRVQLHTRVDNDRSRKVFSRMGLQEMEGPRTNCFGHAVPQECVLMEGDADKLVLCGRKVIMAMPEVQPDPKCPTVDWLYMSIGFMTTTWKAEAS